MCYFLMQHLFFLLFLHSHGDAFALEFLHEVEEVGVELIEFAHFATFPDDVFGNAGKKFMYIISKKVLSLLDVCEIGFFEDFLELGQRTGNLFHVFPLFYLRRTHDYVQALLTAVLAGLEDLPQLVGLETARVVHQVHPFQVDDPFEECDQVLLKIVEHGLILRSVDLSSILSFFRVLGAFGEPLVGIRLDLLAWSLGKGLQILKGQIIAYDGDLVEFRGTWWRKQHIFLLIVGRLLLRTIIKESQ